MEYPDFTQPQGFNHIHQADFLGPRYLHGDGRFYSLNAMDLFSHRIFLHPQRSKSDQVALEGLIGCWQDLGIPQILQVDNQLCFRGSNRFTRSFGQVIRLCLFLGIEMVFIPIREPWRNGAVESFNDTYNKKFFRTQEFLNFQHLKKESKTFELFHNQNHRYSCLKGKTPFQFIREKSHVPKLLPTNFAIPDLDFIPEGFISLIRFIRSDRKLDIFGEKFNLPENLVYTYVRAKILTGPQQLQVYLGDSLVASFPYQLPTSPRCPGTC